MKDDKEKAQMVEEPAIATPSFFDRMKGKDRFKDKEYENEAMALEDALMYIDELEPQTQEAQAFKDSLTATLNAYPQIAYLLEDMKTTGDFNVSLQGMFDNPEDMLLREGDEGYDVAQERRNNRIEQERINSDLKNRYEKNMELFPSIFEEFKAEKGMSDEEADTFIDYTVQLAERIVTGEMGKEEMEKLWQAYRYPEDIAAVDEDLAIADVNANLNEKSSPDDDFEIPVGSTPAAKTMPDMSPKRNPLEEVIQAGM